jgi:serine protease Do
VDDKKIDEENSITEVIRSKKPGDNVTVTFLRDGKEQKMTTALGKWKGINMGTLSPTRVYGNALPRTAMPRTPGGTFIYGGTPRLGLSIQDTDEGKGVKVIDVDDEGNAAKAGIKEDDLITHVNDKEVNSADEISKLMKENKDKVSVRMQVQRAGKAQTIEVRIPRKLKTANL